MKARIVLALVAGLELMGLVGQWDTATLGAQVGRALAASVAITLACHTRRHEA
jgi:hypothetical protein